MMKIQFLTIPFQYIFGLIYEVIDWPIVIKIKAGLPYRHVVEGMLTRVKAR
jgi:hypothetical protein